MGWTRARRPEQKQQRRRDLLDAAAGLFRDRGFDGVPLSEIAAAAGVSKAAVYRYFDSKEQIFLELLVEDYRSWAARLETALAPLAGSNDPDAVAAAMAATTAEHPRLAALSSIVAGVLEHNVTVDNIVGVKTAGAELSLRLTNALHAAIPKLSVEDLGEFLHLVIVLSNGLWPEANPSPVVREVISRPEFQHMQVDFLPALERAVSVTLHGLLSTGEAG